MDRRITSYSTNTTTTASGSGDNVLSDSLKQSSSSSSSSIGSSIMISCTNTSSSSNSNSSTGVTSLLLKTNNHINDEFTKLAQQGSAQQQVVTSTTNSTTYTSPNTTITQVPSITNSNNTDITTMKNYTTKPIKINKRYKKVLCELFNYKDDEIDLERNYNVDDYEFTVDEINTITSNDIIKLFNVKLFDQVQPTTYPDFDRAFHTNRKTTNTLHNYIKAINFYTNFRNYNNNTYNESTNSGNPTHSVRVKNYIKWIDDVEHGRGFKYMESGTMKLEYLPITKTNIVQVPPYTVITTTPTITTTKPSPSTSKATQEIPTTTTTTPTTTIATTASLKHSTDSTKRQKVQHDNIVVVSADATYNNTTHNNNNNNNIITTINNTNSGNNNSTTTTSNNNTQTTAAITTKNNNNTTNTKPVKVNKTYQKLLRDVFIFKKDENGQYREYYDDYIFTIDELNTITSNDIITLLNVKFFDDIAPIRPDFYHAFQIKRRRLSTIYYYIKIISSFVQYRNTNNNTYNEITNIGNPTHSMKVKKYIQWIDDQLNGRAYKYNHDGTMKSEYLSFNEIGVAESYLPIQLPSSPQPNFVPVVVTPSTTKSTISTTTEVTSSITIPISDDVTPAAATTTTTMESLNQMNESIQQLRDTIENSHTAIQLQINTLNDTIQQQYQQIMNLIQQQQQQQNQLLVQQQQVNCPSSQSPNPTK